MSFSEILIYRQLPIVNGYVQVPPNKPSDKCRVTVDEALSSIVDSNTVNLSIGSGKNTGSKHGSQEIFLLPPVAADSWYDTNPIDNL